MRKIMLAFSMIFILGMLSACISIPVGEEVMKISTDGIQFEPKEEQEETTRESEEAEDSTEQTADSEINAEEEGDLTSQDPEYEMDEEAEGVSEEKDNADQVVEDSEDGPETNEACEEQDNSDILDLIDEDFYIPDCAELTKINKKEKRFSATLAVEKADWDKVVEDYEEFFGDDLYQDSKNLSQERADISGYVKENEGGFTKLQIRQRDGFVTIDIRHSY